MREMQCRCMACTAFFPAARCLPCAMVFATRHVFHGTKHKTKIYVLIMTLHSCATKTDGLQSDLQASKITAFVLPRLTVSWRLEEKLCSASSCSWSPWTCGHQYEVIGI